MGQSLSVLFGNRVRALRLERGWDQVDLAAHARISRQHISKIELAQREVCLNTIDRLAKGLGVKPADLLR